MLRPIKSFLNYLQLKTNDSSSSMSEEKCKMLTTTAGINRGDNQVEPQSECSDSATFQKAPHDQNEVIIIAEQVPEKQKCVQGSSANFVVDLTGETLEETINGECMNHFKNITAAENFWEDSDQSGSNADLVIIDDEKAQTIYEVFTGSGNENGKIGDEVEIVISDIDNAVEDDEAETRSEVLDLSLESNEVIILEETDHNDSIPDPVQDPLAIDDYNEGTSNPILSHCGNTATSDTSTEGEVIFTVVSRKEVICLPISKIHNRQSDKNKVDEFVAASGSEDTRTEEQEVRSDGSDSGLGLETSNLQSNNSSIACENAICKPTRSNLKRRSENDHESTVNKKPRHTINFNGVKVYYFPRMQGFGCVPSQGGCTLGMAAHHVQTRTFSLAEHITEQRRIHKQQTQEVNPRSSSSDDTDSEEELSEASGSDLDADANGFLQPVPPRQRRAILKAAGIRKIDSSEKDECRAIRSSREFCGCNCRGYCDPDNCSCSQAGIKCQVDRPSFPCGCTRDGCANVIGRVEFNPSRVRTHYIHTIMRLDLENKQKRNIQMDNPSSTSSILNYANTVVTSSLSHCSNAVSLSGLCHYSNLVSTNHMRNFDTTVSESSLDSHSLTQDISFMNVSSSLYPTRPLHSTSTMPAIDGPSPIRQRHAEHGDNCTTNGLQTPPNNHDNELPYAFRDERNSTLDLTTPIGANSLLGLGDYNTNNTIYQEAYSAHSFLSQNYSNVTFCQSQSANYQQSFMSYTSPASTPIDVSEIGCPSLSQIEAAALSVSDPNYISLNSTAETQLRVDAGNDIIHCSHNVPTTSSSILTIEPISYTMPPSAQTSTSIAEGTQTTVTPPQVSKSSAIFKPAETKSNSVVDLTHSITAPQHKSEEYSEIILGQDTQHIANVSADNLIDKKPDIETSLYTKLVAKCETKESALECKSETPSTSTTNEANVEVSVEKNTIAETATA